MSLSELSELVVSFRNARNWEQFHTLHHLADGLAIEVAELQELLLWKTDCEVEDFLSTDHGKKRVKEELADILIFILYLSSHTRIDLSEAVLEKLRINEAKYPIEKCYGSNKKYTDL
jgi:NTP pyrophosphatase (non-canonical NTP hydrolase)